MWLLPLCPDLAGGQTVTQCTGGRSVPSWQGRSPCFRGAAASQGHPLTSLTWDGGLCMQIFARVSRNTHSLCPASHSLRLSGSCRRLRTGCPGLKESRQSVTDVGFYLLFTQQVYIDRVQMSKSTVALRCKSQRQIGDHRKQQRGKTMTKIQM